jgi:hypothetical protein
MLIKTEKTIKTFINQAIQTGLIKHDDNNYHALSHHWFNVNGGYGKTISDDLCQYIGASLSIVKI